MIETVYPMKRSEERIGGNCRKLPRNVRACGQSGPFPIYIEDYVETYIRRLTENCFPECAGIVLIGQVMETEVGRCLFVRGGICANRICDGDAPVFDEVVWNEVYEKIRLYFPGDEVVGWCVAGPGFRLLREEVFLRAHIDNFADSEKVFLCYESLEKELTVRICADGGFRVLPGYYVYYEKNDEMQNYMLEEEIPAPRTECREKKAEKKLTEYEKEEEPKQEEEVLPKKERNKSMRTDFLQLAAIACIVVLIVSVIVGTDSLSVLKESVLAGEKNATGDMFAVADDEVEDSGTPTRDPEAFAFGDFDFLENGSEKENVTEKPEEKPKEKPETTGENEITEQLQSEEIVPDEENAITDQAQEENDEKQVVEVAIQQPEQENPDVIEEETISVLAPTEYVSYLVKTGDTLAQICKQVYGSVELLDYICELNQLKDIDSIYAGQELIFPKK